MQSDIWKDFVRRMNEAKIRRSEREKVLAEEIAARNSYAAIQEEALRRRILQNFAEVNRLQRDRRYGVQTREKRVAHCNERIDRDLQELARRGIATRDPRLVHFLLSETVVPFRAL